MPAPRAAAASACDGRSAVADARRGPSAAVAARLR
jgi:hypothetical protein